MCSPDIIDRIESFLATASVSEGQHEDGEGRTLDCNQVLVNEYQADQGISVRTPTVPLTPRWHHIEGDLS